MSSSWDSKSEKTAPIPADEILLIDTEDSRNQKRSLLEFLPISNPTQSALDLKIDKALPDANILVGNASNVATPVVMSGDATMDNAGVVTVASSPGLLFAVITKSADQTKVNGDPLPDSELKVALNPNKTYTIKLYIIIDTAATGEIKFGFTVPPGASLLFQDGDLTTNNPQSLDSTTGLFWEFLVDDPPTGKLMTVFISVTTTGTPGDFTVVWHENQIQGTASVKKGSYMEVTES